MQSTAPTLEGIARSVKRKDTVDDKPGLAHFARQFAARIHMERQLRKPLMGRVDEVSRGVNSADKPRKIGQQKSSSTRMPKIRP